ncbi:hypothetical protein H310_10045 [Aphanomyces invadans]|uniref:Uncharacterized protein n=1 Tax=Aphanomyces invadans TaxID=157072 RepID=A0A024TRS7_9STRA|nr:hypothetical protein H310_10045 [Aphanomyces invadans]ETV96728.1 hypothetical protein H310_10045 [Aphanomyces invadans]|eukprot:XP_008874505.1 hypothetical protein H310_10045 [Aphanomyces invadans]
MQHNNASPHRIKHDEEGLNACLSEVCKNMFGSQHPSSPDLSVLDLGNFSPLQSRLFNMPASTLEDLIKNVKTAFENLPSTTIESVFSSLQGVLASIVDWYGDNTFKMKHMKKKKASYECCSN